MNPLYLPADVAADIDLKAIELASIAKSMASVVVTAKRPPIEVRAGKTVVNVDASPTNTGLNVLEILEKSPGVAVDNDGNVSVKGKSGVLISDRWKANIFVGNAAGFISEKHTIELSRPDRNYDQPSCKIRCIGQRGCHQYKNKERHYKRNER